MLGRLSIRAQLTAAFAAALLLVLALAGLFVYVQVRGDLNEALDESLSSRADDVAALISGGGGASDLGAGRLVEGEDGFTQVLSGEGASAQVTASTLSPAAGSAITPEDAARAAEGPAFLEERPVVGIDGEARILARPVSSGGDASIVVVGATTQDRTETLSGLTSAFGVGAPLAVLLASLLGYALAGRALAPVETMRRRAADITLERSGERLPLPRADDEIHQLGATLNAMLDRIEASLERERVFVSDASHELRTPLANLRTELELAVRPGREPPQMREALLSAREEVERLSQLAEDLLVIARSDQGRLPIKREQVDLATLLERVRERFARRAEQSGRRITVDAPSEAASLDPLRIEQAIGNLVENALRHGEGEVRLRARREDGRVELSVSDDGPGFPPGFEAAAFERFSRGDEGRTGGGAGLGLAIAHAIADAHGGEAALANGDGPTVVRLSIPQ